MKKTLITFTLTLLSLFSYSQDSFLNFKVINDNRIIWQYVYNTELSSKDIIDYFKIFGNMSMVENTEKRLIGYSSGENIDFSKYKGVKVDNTIFDNNLSYKIIIELKEKKYRVTILDISFSKDGGMIIDGWGRTGNRSSIINIEYIKDGKFKKSFHRDGSESLDKYFIDKFKARNILTDF